jgi:hypothetical protein
VSDAADIRDIRLPAPQPWLDFISRYWPLLAGVALLLVVLALVWMFLRRRARRRAAPSLLDATLAELEAARPRLLAGDVEGFSVQVSDVIRHYVERRFQVHALSQTTLEFLRACLAQPGSALTDHRQELEHFLKLCDLAKFARWSPSGPEMEALLGSARAFVQGTARPPADAGSGAKAAQP